MVLEVLVGAMISLRDVSHNTRSSRLNHRNEEQEVGFLKLLLRRTVAVAPSSLLL